MKTAGRGVALVVAGTALAVAVAACGSGTSSGTNGGASGKPADPLASLSGEQLFAKVVADGKAAADVRISGTVTDSGTTISMDLGLVHGHGCTGTMAIKGKGSFKLTYISKQLWVKPDKAFYEGVGAQGPALNVLIGKWLKVSETSGLKDFATFCDLSSLLSSFGNTSGMPRPNHATLDGQPVLELKDTGDNAAGYVSDTSTPELVKLTAPSNGGNLTFSGYGVPVALTPPPARMVIDGSRYGF